MRVRRRVLRDGLPLLDRAKAATVDFAAVPSPVLTIAGEYDRLGVSRIARQSAARNQLGQVPEAPPVIYAGPDNHFSGFRPDRIKALTNDAIFVTDATAVWA